MVLAAAVRKGLIKRDSAGTFSILGKRQPAVQSVFQHAAKSGLSPTSLVRAVEVVPASSRVAQELQLPEGDPVFRQIRTRLVNSEVNCNQNNYIPMKSVRDWKRWISLVLVPGNPRGSIPRGGRAD